MTHRQHGIGLVEVLIALSILSVVMLGIAALQYSALAYQQRTQRHLQAVLAAQNLAERMRTTARANSSSYQLDPGTTPAQASVDCNASPCSADALAGWQLANWFSEFSSSRSLLPHAKAAAGCTGNCADGGARLIAVYWNAANDDAAGWDCDADNPQSRDCYRLLWQR